MAVSSNWSCLPSYHHIYTNAISWFSSFFLLSSSLDCSTLASRRIFLLYSSEPISFASPWETLCDMFHPSSQRSWGGEKDSVGTFSKGWNVIGDVFLPHCWICIKRDPTLTLALLKVSFCYKLPKSNLSLSFTLLLSGFRAFVLLFLLFFSNSVPPLFSRGLSLINTGSHVIDVSAEVRTTASITIGISSLVTRRWHRQCSRSFTVYEPLRVNRRTSLKCHIDLWLYSLNSVQILIKYCEYLQNECYMTLAVAMVKTPHSFC